jgi:hypothetical protein
VRTRGVVGGTSSFSGTVSGGSARTAHLPRGPSAAAGTAGTAAEVAGCVTALGLGGGRPAAPSRPGTAVGGGGLEVDGLGLVLVRAHGGGAAAGGLGRLPRRRPRAKRGRRDRAGQGDDVNELATAGADPFSGLGLPEDGLAAPAPPLKRTAATPRRRASGAASSGGRDLVDRPESRPRLHTPGAAGRSPGASPAAGDIPQGGGQRWGAFGPGLGRPSPARRSTGRGRRRPLLLGRYPRGR